MYFGAVVRLVSDSRVLFFFHDFQSRVSAEDDGNGYVPSM